MRLQPWVVKAARQLDRRRIWPRYRKEYAGRALGLSAGVQKKSKRSSIDGPVDQRNCYAKSQRRKTTIHNGTELYRAHAEIGRGVEFRVRFGGSCFRSKHRHEDLTRKRKKNNRTHTSLWLVILITAHKFWFKHGRSSTLVSFHWRHCSYKGFSSSGTRLDRTSDVVVNGHHASHGG
jgi:hypothetical protein